MWKGKDGREKEKSTLFVMAVLGSLETCHRHPGNHRSSDRFCARFGLDDPGYRAQSDGNRRHSGRALGDLWLFADDQSVILMRKLAQF